MIAYGLFEQFFSFTERFLIGKFRNLMMPLFG